MIYLVIIWVLGGCVGWATLTSPTYRFDPYDGESTTPPTIDESQLTLPQLVCFRLLCGPLVWVYSIWQLLGLWGKRS